MQSNDDVCPCKLLNSKRCEFDQNALTTSWAHLGSWCTLVHHNACQPTKLDVTACVSLCVGFWLVVNNCRGSTDNCACAVSPEIIGCDSNSNSPPPTRTHAHTHTHEHILRTPTLPTRFYTHNTHAHARKQRLAALAAQTMGSGAATACHRWPIELKAAVRPPLIAVHFFWEEQVEDERDGNPQSAPVLIVSEWVCHCAQG